LWIVLLTSAVATVVGLLPPYGMKVIFDNVFTGKPLADAHRLVALSCRPRRGGCSGR
jgi:hypothetical protein